MYLIVNSNFSELFLEKTLTFQYATNLYMNNQSQNTLHNEIIKISQKYNSM